MTEQETLVFGMPVPSDDELFLAIVGIHIVLGIVCVLSGLAAMLCNKGRGAHSISGKVYYWGLVLVFITVIVLSIMRWPMNNHLLTLGTLSFATAYFGRRLARNPRPGWTRLHTVCMGSSYIFLLTAFYVDNGKNLPFWKIFPQVFFWLFPVAVGLPIIAYVLSRHRLNRRKM